ncbi:phage tail-collar fiber domain-containing protein [Aeromonas veronii]|uniref:phage tail-collar fiber domain-containing protein n=1 Tax=Aeromonas veronii TaxID=654 RepID=UPI0040558D6A
MSAIYSALPTNAGQAKIANALALGVPLKITHMAVGDGNGQPVTPDPAKTALVHEVRRAPLNTLFQDPLNQAQLVAEQIIPEDVGDWWIREVGLYDEAGTLIAIANCPDTYKPLLTSGAGRTQVIRMVLIVSDTSAVELKIDPAVVLATRKYVDDLMKAELAKLDCKQSVRVATTANIALSATQTIDGVALVVGDRVLVKDQADAKQNGIYLAAAQAWTRATDADTGAKLSSGARIGVEEGTLNAGKVWYLATTGAITLGTTALAFKDEHPDATEIVRGVTRYATQAEVDEPVAANQKDDVAITPKRLAPVIVGRLIGVQVFTSSATYTPTAGTKSVVVEVQGGGGAGGGAATTGAGTISASVGGAAGSYGKGRFTAGFSGVAVTIGAGGAGVSGGAGSSGGASSFGGLISAPGGAGTYPPGAGAPAGFSSTERNSGVPTGANICSVLGQGGGSPAGLVSPPMALGGIGGASYFGCGGSGENGITGEPPQAGLNPGSGGGGAASGNNAGITKAGKNGAAGIVIVWEYA